MSQNVHFSSATNEWATPQDFFDKLNTQFDFNLDPCATAENAKCKKFFTIEDNGLEQDWSKYRVFCNPPYGRGLKDWVRKAYEESKKGALVVMLLPARTDTSYWHDYVVGGGADVRYLRGRLKFGGSENSAPFPSALVMWWGREL